MSCRMSMWFLVAYTCNSTIHVYFDNYRSQHSLVWINVFETDFWLKTRILPDIFGDENYYTSSNQCKRKNFKKFKEKYKMFYKL